MAKKRVHEIAKEAGLSSKDVLAKLQAAGLEVKAAASTVEEADALKALGVNGAAPKAAAKPTAPAKADAPKAEAPKAEAKAAAPKAEAPKETAPKAQAPAQAAPAAAAPTPAAATPAAAAPAAQAPPPLRACRTRRRARPGTDSPPAAPGRVAAARAR